VIDGRECGGRRLTGQRLTGAHALEWLPPHRSHALGLSLPVIPLSIGRSACLQAPPTYSCTPKWAPPRNGITHGAAKAVWREGMSQSRSRQHL
jgi:hypothetical protein